MKPRVLVLAVAALAVAALAVWFFAIRGGKARKGPPVAAAAADDPWAASPRPAPRPDAPDRNRGGGDPLDVQVDDDPIGTQRIEGVVMTADEQPVAGATV